MTVRHVIAVFAVECFKIVRQLKARAVLAVCIAGPFAFAAVNVPPCCVITRWAKARPTPCPLVLVVKKGMKMRCKSAGAMPAPLSLISIVAHCLSA